MKMKQKIIDLHSHTYYSNCSNDNPRELIKTAIQNNIDVLGINDHNYGIGDRKDLYLNEINVPHRTFYPHWLCHS